MGEVAGNAAELFDPESQGEITAALERLLGDPARRQELIRLGAERCAMFTWEQTARATLRSYRRALRGRLP